MDKNKREFDILEEDLFESEKVAHVTKDEIEGNDDGDCANFKSNYLVIDKSDPTIESLYIKYKRNDVILRPKFQRNYVMKKTIASRLIESLLLNIPLPTFYFAEEEDLTCSVIDGQQRLTSIFHFIDGNITDEKNIDGKKIEVQSTFKLNGLKILTELNGKTFKELSSDKQRQINNTPLHIITIKKDSDADLKFEIFERLNTGSTPLNEDEIRNTVYRGNFIDLLADLEENKDFNYIVNKPNFKNRMLYRGMILRFLAFSEKSYLNYKPSMKRFCNEFLRDFRDLDNQKATYFKNEFKKCLGLAYSVFGKHAFRRFAKVNNTNNCDWINNKINMALFDIEMCGFKKYTKEQVMPHIEEIQEAMINLMINDQAFIEAIQMKTSNTDMVNYRFETWYKKLNNIIIEKSTPRFFTYEQKRQLYEANPTCGICGQQINCIDDAHVDHILARNNGGSTTLGNAQIAHRWCNLHKSDK